MMNAAFKRVTIAVALIALVLLPSACKKDPQKAKMKYLASGQDYMKKGKYGDAAVEFRNALRIDPRFVDAYYQLAQADMAQKDWHNAYVALQKVIELDPNRFDAILDRGRFYLAGQNFLEADTDAQSIIDRDPNNAAAYQLLGASLFAQQKLEAALQPFKKVVELRPHDASAYVNLAMTEIGLRNYPDAEEHLKKAIAVDPKFIQAYTDLANFYRLTNRKPEAEQTFQEGIAKSPDGTVLYLGLASMLANEGRKEDAEAVLDRLRKQLPNSISAARDIGDFYFQRRETNRALVEYQRALSLSPKNKNLEIELRVEDLYLSTGQTQQAASLDQELMKDAPKNIFVRIHHGRLLMAQGNAPGAITYLQKVVVDDADSEQAHYYLAMAYWQNGELGQARSALIDVLKVKSELPVALEALGRLSLTQQNYADAQVYAQGWIKRQPADPGAHQLLAEALAGQEQFKSAEEQILIAKQLAPNDPIIRANLAQIYRSEKKWPEAQKEFEAALQLDPHSTTVLRPYVNYLISRNQFAEALVGVQKYVTTNSGDADGHVLLGTLYYQSKNFDSAQAEFERAIQLNPNHVQATILLGNIFKEQGKIDLAIASYQRALDSQPRSAPLATLVGNMYLDKGDLDTARKYYAQALDADPNFAVALSNTAWVDAQQNKNLDVALGMAQKAKSLMPDKPYSITDVLAWVMYKRGDYAGSISLLKDCVQKSPETGQFHYHYGMALLATGHQAEGKKELEAALQKKLNNDADAQQAQQALARLN